MSNLNNKFIKDKRKKIMKPVWQMIKEAHISQQNLSEEIYLGGEREKKKKKTWCSKLCSPENTSFTKKEFKNMSEEEQQERI